MLRLRAGKLLGLILAGSVGGALAAYGLSVLDNYGSFLTASVATVLFFGGGWLFNCGLTATQEPIRITISATELVELNELSGQQRRWSFAEISAYRVLPEFRGITTLRLTLRGGYHVWLSASNLSLTKDDSRAQFERMRQAFELAWHQYKSARTAVAGVARGVTP